MKQVYFDIDTQIDYLMTLAAQLSIAALVPIRDAGVIVRNIVDNKPVTGTARTGNGLRQQGARPS